VTAPAALDLHDPAFQADPYPTYASLRAGGPVQWSPSLGTWVVTGHAEATALLRDPRWSADGRHADDHAEFVARREAAGLFDSSGRVMLFMDPPDHTRLRGLVSKAFTPRTVENLRPWVARLMEDLLDEFGDGGDVMPAIAYRLPVAVICELLGVPESDRGLFREHTSRFAGILEFRAPDDVLRTAAEGFAALGGYLFDLCEQRRADPREDLVSLLVQAEEAGDRLSPEELLSTCILLLVAGHETTMNLLGNGVLALGRHPDQWARLRAEPAIAPIAVEELLRYDSPVQLTVRTASDGLDLGGQRIAKGQQAVVFLGAVNRDPARFARPDDLDLGRADARHHLSLGHGGHYCLGAPLARLEGQEAFAAMARRWKTLEVPQDVVFRRTLTLRALESLDVRVA